MVASMPLPHSYGKQAHITFSGTESAFTFHLIYTIYDIHSTAVLSIRVACNGSHNHQYQAPSTSLSNLRSQYTRIGKWSLDCTDAVYTRHGSVQGQERRYLKHGATENLK